MVLSFQGATPRMAMLFRGSSELRSSLVAEQMPLCDLLSAARTDLHETGNQRGDFAGMPRRKARRQAIRPSG